MDALGRNFDFGNTTEGEQQLYEILRWLCRGLFHDVADSIGNRRLKHHTLGLQASQIHTHELAHLQHGASLKMVSPPEKKCKPASSALPAADSVLATAPRHTLMALKGEAIYAATDYRIEGRQLFCVLRSGGECAFDLNKVDWEKTTRLNAERGITVNVRGRPRVQ